MGREPRKRGYDSRSRRAAAARTRRAILAAARQLFPECGYAGTTMPSIARASGVALDTIYATVGKKPELFRLLVETAISGHDEAQPAEQRDYVKAIRAEPDAMQKLRLYSSAVCRIQPRLAPLFMVLQAAAPVDPGLHALWHEISERRATNMRLLARELAATGRLRAGLSEPVAADILWSMNSPELYLLLVGKRGWSPGDFEAWLADSWGRLLLGN